MAENIQTRLREDCERNCPCLSASHEALDEQLAINAQQIDRIDALEAALREVIILAEYRTTGPDTLPRCKSDALTSKQATSLRGSISAIARAALALQRRTENHA